MIGSGAAEPGTLVAALTARAAELRDVRIIHIFTLGDAPYVAPEHAASFRHCAFFVGPNVRHAVQEGRADFVPVHLHEIPDLFETRAPIDWALVALSPPLGGAGGSNAGVTRATVRTRGTVSSPLMTSPQPNAMALSASPARSPPRPQAMPSATDMRA